MTTLGVHQITAVEADPVSFVSIAAETGCQEISVFVHLPDNHRSSGSGTRWRPQDG